MVPQVGFEPTTYGLENRCSFHWAIGIYGTDNRTRTYIYLVRSQAFFPLNYIGLWSTRMELNHPFQNHNLAYYHYTTSGMFGAGYRIRTYSFLGVNEVRSQLRQTSIWWNWWDLNPRSSTCKAGAFPTKLQPHMGKLYCPWVRNFKPENTAINATP